jgi:hypothetical protein
MSSVHKIHKSTFAKQQTSTAWGVLQEPAEKVKLLHLSNTICLDPMDFEECIHLFNDIKDQYKKACLVYPMCWIPDLLLLGCIG